MRTFNYTSTVLKDVIPGFLAIRKTAVADKTYYDDCLHLASLDLYLADNNVTELDAYVLDKWIASLKPLSASTIHTYIRSARVLFQFLNLTHKEQYPVPDYQILSDDYTPHYYTAEEKKAICHALDNYKCISLNQYPWITVELPMIIRILEGCGTRISEVLSIKKMHVHLDKMVIKFEDETKNGKHRLVPVSRNLGEILARYCIAMGINDKPDAFLFPGKTKEEHLPLNVVSERFRGILRKTGIVDKTQTTRKHERGTCLYNYRHTFAIDSLKQMASLDIDMNKDLYCRLSLYVGHDSLLETQKYLKFSMELFPDVLQEFNEQSDNLIDIEDQYELWGL